MKLSTKSLKTFGVVFAILTILTGVCKIVALLGLSPHFSLPNGLPVIFMLAAVGCVSAAKKKERERI